MKLRTVVVVHWVAVLAIAAITLTGCSSDGKGGPARIKDDLVVACAERMAPYGDTSAEELLKQQYARDDDLQLIVFWKGKMGAAGFRNFGGCGFENGKLTSLQLFRNGEARVINL